MSRLTPLAAATAFALSGCGAGGDNESANATNASSGSRTENGQLTARVQGVDLKVNLPPPIRRMTEDNDLLYPGASTEGDGGASGRRFHSGDAIDAVARWYQDPARASRFTIRTVERRGDGWQLLGETRNGIGLLVRLDPGANGGTDGRVVLAVRH